MVRHYLKRDGLCATHNLEYDSEELFRNCEEVINLQEVRSAISMIYHMEVRRLEERAGVSWLLSDKAIRREVGARFKQLFGERFDA